MYKILEFGHNEYFGRVAKVEFSFPKRGGYAYLVGSFNAFNEGSFRMREKGDRWHIVIDLPEAIWYYGFSLDGKYTPDIENPERTLYRRLSYKFEREVSIARIWAGDEFYHEPSLLYIYSFADRTHVLFRAVRGRALRVILVTDESVGMRKKASDELFDYFEAILPRVKELSYTFEIETEEGSVEYGDFTATPKELSTPKWIFSRVFYQIMPDRFERESNEEKVGGDPKIYGGNLPGILKRLDYIEGLRVNALYLTPIFESITYHGYDVIDYFNVAKRLGGNAAFEKLVRELKRRDIKLILDGVFHHTSFFHPHFQDVVRKGVESVYRDFYRITGFPVVSQEFLEILNSEEPWEEKFKRLKNLDWNYESFFSVWLMPRLNHDDPRVRKFIAKVMNYWLEKGIDGWRLDVAHGIPPDLWREIRKEMPEDAYLVGEVMDDARMWLFDKFHGTMNYPLYEAILRFFVTGEITAEEFLNYLELLSTYYGPAEYMMYNFLDNHDVERFLDLVGDRKRYLCALAFLMTYKGIPSIFYGDEIGLSGMEGKGLEVSRTPMRWEGNQWDTEILKVTKALIRLRRNSRALQLGFFRPLKFKGRLLVYERIYEKEHVLVAINCSSRVESVLIPEKYRPIVGKTSIELAPWSFIVVFSRFNDVQLLSWP
ncbi:glycoside hydrolase family 13 protein [Pyrococcus yayanosii]|uniref:Cyclomaltodextrinase n=1 Tax=Pyrococcus yayanosii (strain CH1 / JCM 16557) TaxID=529709 RepID=F8AHJ5_PYRYC|nr:glycoside hydrolase family 13 protein [Pyrococcus yayanosii]AEH25366.1 cyclomaltodextrinase [Pyrococcus yayanosii CH1]